jgi:hypothetical protein
MYDWRCHIPNHRDSKNEWRHPFEWLHWQRPHGLDHMLDRHGAKLGADATKHRKLGGTLRLAHDCLHLFSVVDDSSDRSPARPGAHTREHFFVNG